VKEPPCRDFPCRIENQISTRLSQEARVGVKWKCTFGCAHEIEEFDATPAEVVSTAEVVAIFMSDGRR
jgi:hypothetical protein